MKKLLVWLLCLLLPLLPALAEESAELPLFLLSSTDEAGVETTVGSALLFLDQGMLLTTAPVGDLDALTAYGPDNSAYGVVGAYEGLDGLMLLVLDARADTLPVMLSQRSGLDGYLVGVTRNGLRYAATAQNASWTRYEGREACLISAKEPLLPGAMLLDAWGDIIGVTVATWGEGEARYVALTGSGLRAAMLMDQDDGIQWLSDVKLSQEAGILTVDWSESAIEEGSTFMVFVQDINNLYYSYYQVDEGTMTQDVYLVPGRSYAIWVCCARDGAELNVTPPAQYAISLEAPDRGMFTNYGFSDESYLGWTPIDETPETTAELPKLEPITGEALQDTSKSLYLHVTNTYNVDEEIEAPMLITLQTPENFMFLSVNGFIFGPEYQDYDVWNADITDLFAAYQQYGWGEFMPGEYQVRYFIDGLWAGGFSFTLE